MLNGPVHSLNFFAGWILILLAFVTGAGVGLRFHRHDFLGGYASFRRRVVRLGHIALAALGIINVIYALCPWPASGTLWGAVASIGFAVGGATMPAVCFLTGWRESFRAFFFIPVAALIAAVVSVLLGAMS